MDLDKLYCTINWLKYSSFTLSNETNYILTNSLLIVRNENHFKKMFFWGVIQSLDVDYYIAYGYKQDAITDVKFFYSTNNQDWKLLPTPLPEHMSLTELCKRPFQGDPGLVIEVVDDALSNEFNHNKNLTKDSGSGSTNKLNGEKESTSSKSEQRITNGELKEEDRLAATIKLINEETLIVPRGGLFKQTDGVVVHSRAFEGITLDDADELVSFQHYRQPQQDWNTNLLTRVDYNYAIDFLDTIDKDQPADCWKAKLVEGHRVIILRHLIWPGFTFFHHLETPEYGSIYVGDGLRNLDVPFMIQINEANKDPADQKKSKEDLRSSTLNESKVKRFSKELEPGHFEVEEDVLFPDYEEIRESTKDTTDGKMSKEDLRSSTLNESTVNRASKQLDPGHFEVEADVFFPDNEEVMEPVETKIEKTPSEENLNHQNEPTLKPRQ